MKNLLDINDLEKEEILEIWNMVSSSNEESLNGQVAWSFEGNGIRTRTTFLQAFKNIGLNYIELPNFLKTGESTEDLAGYMDSFYSMYVIRENNHSRLSDFATQSCKPVINAMSNKAHPCEVLSDAYYLSQEFDDLQKVRILLWGPTTNVFKSWHNLSKILELNLTHYCPPEEHFDSGNITFTSNIDSQFDIVVTDAWPTGFNNQDYTFSKDISMKLGSPILLPTPPVTVGQEISSPITEFKNFAGYEQKKCLLSVQEQIVRYYLKNVNRVTGRF